uniref:translation initiation factor IF-2-like n=1 Tax=Callithrix jacchus TaxID=9483 RepID=UPI00159E13B9|nr:translation initiation factor IF-2-like [Callithrix jacchus]XP_054103013.1 translation initiation factor IF-2-like [Callithrix jacchus]
MPQAPTRDSPTRGCPGRRAARTGWGEGVGKGPARWLPGPGASPPQGSGAAGTPTLTLESPLHRAIGARAGAAAVAATVRDGAGGSRKGRRRGPRLRGTTGQGAASHGEEPAAREAPKGAAATERGPQRSGRGDQQRARCPRLLLPPQPATGRSQSPLSLAAEPQIPSAAAAKPAGPREEGLAAAVPALQARPRRQSRPGLPRPALGRRGPRHQAQPPPRRPARGEVTTEAGARLRPVRPWEEETARRPSAPPLPPSHRGARPGRRGLPAPARRKTEAAAKTVCRWPICLLPGTATGGWRHRGGLLRAGPLAELLAGGVALGCRT